ncbi:MAG: hypothetical protein IJA94_03795 [Bacilli bacterium]|nr:hypothetical protein [Bacilli bacterium]
MKKKILSLLIILTLFVCPMMANADKKVSDYSDVSSTHFYKDDGYKAGGATIINFEDGGSAYCVDPGKVTATSGASCTSKEVTGQQAAGAAYIFSSNADEETKALAMRIYSTATGTSRFQNSSSKDVVNTQCGYISAASQASSKAGYKMSEGLTSKKSSYGANCASEFGVQTDEIGTAAIDLAAGAISASGAGTGSPAQFQAPSCSAKNANGKVTITCSNVPSGAKLTVTGDLEGAGTTEVSGSVSKSFNATKKDDGSGNCGTYSATLTYSGAANACTKVVQYNCNLGSGAQNYMGCDQTSNGGGESTIDIASGEPINCGADPDDPGDEDCREIPGYTDNSSGGVPGAFSGLCDSFGQTVVTVTEGDEYTSTDESIDACIIGEEDITGTSLKATEMIMGETIKSNEYCDIYCTEDYEFLSPGPLSTLDKNGNEYLITSGSYFNFEPDEAYDETHISCYGENYIDKLMENIVNKAQQYANTLSETTVTCTTWKETLDDGSKETKEAKTTTTKEYVARRKGSSLAVEIVNDPTKSGTITEEVAVGTCVAQTIKADDATIAAKKAEYINYSNEQVGLYEQCNSWDFGNLEKAVSKSGNCHPSVSFTYTDGEWLRITSKDLELVNVEVTTNTPTTTYKSTTGKYQSNKTSKKTSVSLGIGSEKTKEFTDANYTSGSATIKNTYKLNSVGICNDYNKGESYYNYTKDQCEEMPGTVYTEGWPVDYETPQGQYSYQFIVSNYGHHLHGGKCKAGRLEAVAYELGLDEVDLICPYNVNGCTDCDWGCDPEGMCWGDPDCDDECIWQCRSVGCVFDISNGLAIDFSPISLMNPFAGADVAYLNNVHKNALAYNSVEAKEENNVEDVVATATPNTEGLAANWRTEKGQAALANIKNSGEEAYTEDNLVYSITLEPNDINRIRDYNDSVEDAGGYLNNTLNCINLTNDYVICTSTYLDTLAGELDNNKIEDNLDELDVSERIWSAYKGKKSQEGPAFR